jgi:hypothetical protein
MCPVFDLKHITSLVYLACSSLRMGKFFVVLLSRSEWVPGLSVMYTIVAYHLVPLDATHASGVGSANLPSNACTVFSVM